MLFNSVQFAVFLPIVFALYWLLSHNLRRQNLLLLFASYVFYGSWDYRFLFLLMFSTALDYFTGIKMHRAASEKSRTWWFCLSVIVNLGFLGIFKYYNFFASSLADAIGAFGYKPDFWTLNVILPVGISFYTFHGLSYVIDIYRRKIEPTTDFIEYSVFVSFFPLLVAGPIERATHLLPQIKVKRTFSYPMAVDGMRQVLWGLFKKIAVADNCARYANQIFNDPGDYSGSTLFMGAFFFAIQIYCDFSGYSDIAIGTAKLFGIELLRNFAFPYFSRDIAEFWRRWHISLTTWFRDYLYIPLGGSTGGTWIKIRNTFIIFLVSGFWHGANWTFIAWGLLNALYFLPLLLTNQNRAHTDQVAKGRFLPSLKELMQMGVTFFLTLVAWVVFRAQDLQHAVNYLKGLFSWSLFSLPTVHPRVTLLLILFMLAIEWLQRDRQHALQIDTFRIPRFARWVIYYVLIIVIILFAGSQQNFIYFQF